MSNILNNGGAGDQKPDHIDADETLDPVAPAEPTLQRAGFGVPTVASEPESSVGTGMNPP
jgi:hypothetical protein